MERENGMIAIKDMEMPKNCLDCPISHEDEIDYCICGKTGKNVYLYANEIHPDCPLVEIVTCKDCKQWKDSDGVYRRGLGAESKCPINIKEVFDGNFYCANAERRK